MVIGMRTKVGFKIMPHTPECLGGGDYRRTSTQVHTDTPTWLYRMSDVLNKIRKIS